jgi:Uma2 family endonuclease
VEQALPTPLRYSVAEYLAMEAAATERHEYRDGEIIATAGATSTHNSITHNLHRRLGEKLDGTPREVFGSDQRVRAHRTRYCYPDLTVACAPLAYDPPEGELILTNPRVLIEVLSPSTEADDRGEKFDDYRRLPSFEEYLLVAPHRPRAEPFYRNADGEWMIGRSVEGLDAVLRVRCLRIDIPLAQVYARVDFPRRRRCPAGRPGKRSARRRRVRGI